MRMLSIIASNMLGSVGGLTFLNNPFHQIVVRQRTVPVQPNTTPQVYSKNAFSSGIQAWEQEDDAERAAWAAFAQTVTFVGPLGPYQPTGRMLAVAQYQISEYLLNANIIGVDGGSSMEAPVQPGMLIITNPRRSNPGGGQTGFAIIADNNNGEDVIMYASISFLQSDARNFFKGPFVQSTLAAVQIPAGQSDEIEFNGLEDTGVYFVRLRFITDPVGRRYSQEVILRFLASTSI